MKQAIVIGIDYKGTVNELPDCQIDADNIEKQLLTDYSVIEKYYEITPSEFLESIKNAAQILTENDTLTIFYSGHGTQIDSALERDYTCEALCFFKNKRITCLLDKDFKNMISILKCHVIVCFDSCYSGGMNQILGNYLTTRHKVFDPQNDELYRHRQFRNTSKPKSISYMLSCSENETSVSTGQGGLFTLGILASLKDKKKEIGIVMREVKKYCTKYQKPILSNKDKKQLIF
jgi:hypothetical protein